jgi:PEP-CTERM motif
MRTTLKALLLLVVLSGGVLLHADVTVGTYNSGNCYPFMCNDTGTNVGPSIDYQQVYASSSFSGVTTITDLTFYYAAQFGGNALAIGGAYTFEWGYGGTVNGLSTNLGSNYTSGPFVIGTATIPVGGVNDNPSITFNGFSFTYDPSLGNLLLEIVVNNQDIVGNGSGNGYNEADTTGAVTSRAYCLGGTINTCFADANGLVTTFSTGTTVPEPGTLVMLGSGIIGLTGVLRRKLSL